MIPFKAFRQARKRAGIPKFCYPTAPVHTPKSLIRPHKKFPGVGPRAYRICNTVREKSGACAGDGLAGGGLEGPASP